jgi:hypothetical protein
MANELQNTEKTASILNRGILLMLLGILFVIILGIDVSAHPPLPTEFYGRVTSFNQNATSGTVKAYAGAVECGTFNIVNGGFFGVLSCKGDDPETGGIEGGTQGQNISFRFNTNPTSAFGSLAFDTGEFHLVNIVNPVVTCGDGFCDFLESCVSCSADCFTCNATNTTGNNTGNSSNGTGGGGGGGGGGSGGSGGAGISGTSTSTSEPPQTCTENWQCLNWTSCTLLGVRTRSCYDANSCGTYDSKPKEAEECVYVGSCFDALINCHDGGCEEGLDCGGPCQKKCSVLEQALQNVTVKVPTLAIPKEICSRHIELNNKGLWIFLAVISLAFVARYIYADRYVRRLRKNEQLKTLERSRKIYSSKQKTLLFSITLLALTCIALLYSYFFLLCPNDFISYSWILIVLLILAPLTIHTIMRKNEYSVTEHVTKEKKLGDIHYQNIMKMMELENNILAEEENEISSKLYELSRKEDFQQLMEAHPQLKNIYKDIINLCTQYKDKKNPYTLEKDFCGQINALDKDEQFKKELQKHPDLRTLFERLHKLYVQYEEKEKLYEKLEEMKDKKEGS